MQRSGAKMANLMILMLMVSLGLSMARYAPRSWGLLALLALPILVPFLIGPFLIHRTHWTSLEPTFLPFNPQGPDSPPEVWRHFAPIAEELQRLGFSPERSCRSKKSTPNADGFVSLFRNRKTSESARLITAIGSNGIVRNVSSLAVFITEFADGTEVVTSNRASPRVFPVRKPPYHGATFPQVREIGHLLDIHRALVHRYEGGRIRVAPLADDPDEYLRQKDHIRPLAHHVDCGYTYVDEMAGVQRLTWKGAFLMAWKLTPPIKQIRLAWERFRASRLLRELEAEREARVLA